MCLYHWRIWNICKCIQHTAEITQKTGKFKRRNETYLTIFFLVGEQQPQGYFPVKHILIDSEQFLVVRATIYFRNLIKLYEKNFSFWKKSLFTSSPMLLHPCLKCAHDFLLSAMKLDYRFFNRYLASNVLTVLPDRVFAPLTNLQTL